jgi:hypothetical protein
MTNPDDDALITELRGLPTKDAEPAAAKRILHEGVEVFVETKAAEGHPWRLVVTRATRALTPIVVAGTVGVYLAWAVSTANSLFP